jgi:hypothetical protein
VNEDLEAIHRRSIENGLLFNPAKSQAILVSISPPGWHCSWHCFLGDIALDWKEVVIDLGPLIVCRLWVERHITKISSSVYITLHCDFWSSWRRRVSDWSFARLFFCHIFFTVILFSRYCLIWMVPTGSITCPYIGMSSWACLFLSILIFAYCLFFRLIRSEKPRYLYSVGLVLSEQQILFFLMYVREGRF